MPAKKIAVSIAAAVFILSSCGKAGAPAVESQGDFTNDIKSDVQNDYADIAAEDPARTTPSPDSGFIDIKWGYFAPADYEGRLNPETSRITEYLERQFGVTFSFEISDDTYLWPLQKEQMGENSLPDIFVPSYEKLEPGTVLGGGIVVGDIDSYKFTLDEFIGSGAIRKIPWEMVERYAPNYAAMAGPGGENLKGRNPYETADYFLFRMYETRELFEPYSVYRLDWLEELGIEPKGKLIEIVKGIYFTEEAYDLNEFAEIMRAFSGMGDGTRRGLIINRFGMGLWNLVALMGAYGANNSNIKENGKAVYSAGSESFKNFMKYVERLVDMDVSTNPDDIYIRPEEGRYGWWSSYSMMLGSYAELIDGGAKLLVTPPEIGPDGRQGTDSAAYIENGFTYSSSFAVGANVSDEKLAKILEIFDALSFDPFLYVLVNYGFEGDDYYWQGERYNSPVVRVPESVECVGFYGTFIRDETAGKRIYDYPIGELYDFASSEKAISMLLPPYKSDPEDLFADDLKNLQAKYTGRKRIQLIQQEFFEDIINGRKTVAFHWDGYMAELEASGLREYEELLERYPVTARQYK